MEAIFTQGARARDCVGVVLKHVLADESRLAAATRDYVWRVRGSPLQSLKRLFAEQGRQVDRWVSELAAHARSLGIAMGAVRDATSPDRCGEQGSPAVMIGELLALHEDMVTKLRTDVAVLEEDESEEASFLEGLLEFHETTAWMLRLVLNEGSRSAESHKYRVGK